MGVGSCSVRILPAPIGGGGNDETNNALDTFCSGSYGARRFRLDSERADIPLGRGRRYVRPARLKRSPGTIAYEINHKDSVHRDVRQQRRPRDSLLYSPNFSRLC